MSGLLGPAEVRDLAERLMVNPTKKLGQNFVHDPNTVRRIVRLAGVQAGNRVVEIGPGLGSLTLGLLEADASVLAIEIDPRLAEALPTTVGVQLGDEAAVRLDVVLSDALEVRDFTPPTGSSAAPGVLPVRVVANLPYNVSVPVLLHLLEHVPTLQSGVVMVQSEVGERIAAAPGSKIYGSPSVKAAWYGDFRVVGKVGRQIFWPVPNVDSVLVGFQRHASEPGDADLRRRVFSLVDAAFGQRRKMLRQALSGVLGSSENATATLERAGVDPTARGERLTIDDFLAIARATA